MDVAQIIPIAAVLAWSTIWLQFVVIQFFGMTEKLHKDYVDSGSLDAAISFVESQKLIPGLGALVELAIKHRRGRTRVPIEEILQSVDYLPFLQKIDAASQEKESIDSHLSMLQRTAEFLWKMGFWHILLTVGLWLVAMLISTQFKTVGSKPVNAWWWIAATIVAMGWLVTLTTMVWKLFRFSSRRNALLAALRANRATEAE